MRTLSLQAPERIGQEITVEGWVHSRRDHGGLVFVDLRDHTGVLQLVINPEHADEAFHIAEELRDEYVIRAVGVVNERAPELQNDKIPTGRVELAVKTMTILNRAEALPIAPASWVSAKCTNPASPRSCATPITPRSFA